MKIATLKIKLIELLQQRCLSYLDKIQIDLAGETIYAFVIFCVSGCEGLYAFVATNEGLKRLNQISAEQEPYPEYDQFNAINVAEWESIGDYSELFYDIQNNIRQFYDIYFDNNFDDLDLQALSVSEYELLSEDYFVDVITTTLNNLKHKACFTGKNFDKEMLFGALFPDPYGSDINIIERVSEKVNSEKWHNLIKLQCDLIRASITK